MHGANHKTCLSQYDANAQPWKCWACETHAATLCINGFCQEFLVYKQILTNFITLFFCCLQFLCPISSSLLRTNIKSPTCSLPSRVPHAHYPRESHMITAITSPTCSLPSLVPHAVISRTVGLYRSLDFFLMFKKNRISESSSIQYGYSKSSTRARLMSQTFVRWTSKN